MRVPLLIVPAMFLMFEARAQPWRFGDVDCAVVPISGVRLLECSRTQPGFVPNVPLRGGQNVGWRGYYMDEASEFELGLYRAATPTVGGVGDLHFDRALEDVRRDPTLQRIRLSGAQWRTQEVVDREWFASFSTSQIPGGPIRECMAFVRRGPIHDIDRLRFLLLGAFCRATTSRLEVPEIKFVTDRIVVQ